MRRTTRYCDWCVCASLAILAYAFSGCGSNGPARYEVNGSIRANGQPVPSGYIVFEPDTTRGNSGPAGRATIVDGSYETDDGRGMVGGPHVVRIFATDGVAVEIPGEGLNEFGTPLGPDLVQQVDFPMQDTTHDFDFTAPSR